MPETFTAVPVTDRVHWVGAVDWSVRNFHGYETGRGTTYNAYLVTGEKNVLLDTVKAPFSREMLRRVASVLDPASIDVIISHHTEMDHTGAMPEVLRAVKPDAVYASKMGVQALKDHFGDLDGLTSVEDGQTLRIGDASFTFVETRMLHWPDSMFSYLQEEKVLFSNDAFGMHLASSERFADELPRDLLEQEGAKYYANILLPLSGIVLKLFEKMEGLALPLSIIAPDHGPIWRREPEAILGLYKRWASQKRDDSAVVVYDTMWGSTRALARAAAEGLAGNGTRVKVMEIGPNHRSDVATEILEAGALLAGSPTMNNNLFPTVADVLTYLKGLKPKGLVGAAFGSFGWSGEAVKQLADVLDAMKVETVGEPLKVKYVPGPEELARARALGADVSKRLKARRR